MLTKFIPNIFLELIFIDKKQKGATLQKHNHAIW